MAEWSIAAVLKTVEPQGSGGSNPSFSANECERRPAGRFFNFMERRKPDFRKRNKIKKENAQHLP
jgi:hypothetical protein